MKKISEFIKDLGFTFSFRRLKKALLLVILFSVIGISIHMFYELEESESWLKMIYSKEVSQKMDLGEKNIIKITKKDINDDRRQDLIFIVGKELRSGESTLNSIVEQYKDVDLIIIDGKTDQISIYNTNKDFKTDINLQICEDEKERYFMISDLSGNVSLCKLNKEDMQDINNNIVDIIKNTTENEFLGYTIYTKKNSDNSNILDITIDNFSKEYIGEYKDTKTLDFSQLNIDISRYRETYLRDKFSKFELKDINHDGILEFVAYQYILYNLDDEAQKDNKTLGKIETVFNIEDEKIKFLKVDINI